MTAGSNPQYPSSTRPPESLVFTWPKFSVQKRQMKLLIVIANYRVAHLTIDCLRSIATEIGSVAETRVAVCENGTGDNSAERIQKAITENGWSSWCTLTAVTPNLGFTGGNNVILEPALHSADPPQYILLLNADTIVQHNAFRVLVDFMDQHPSAGIAGSGLEYPDGAPQRSAFRFHTPMSEFNRSLSLGLVSRFLKRWEIAPPLPETRMRSRLGRRGQHDHSAGGLRENRIIRSRILYAL